MLLHLVQVMRETQTDVSMLTEVAISSTWLAGRVQFLAIEEFILIVRGKVGFIFSRSFFRAWQLCGEVVHYSAESDRWLAVQIKHKQRVYTFAVGYAPTQSCPDPEATRTRFFDQGSIMLERLPNSHRTICAGDFNSHLSAEAWKDNELTGKRGLRTPTSGRGNHLIEFVQENNLHIVDRHMPCRRRGAWWNASNKKWYENDVFLSDGIFTPGAWHRLTTRTIAGCDHRAKALEMNMMGRHVQWHKPKKEGEVELDAFGKVKNRHRIRWDQTRGGSDLAAEAKQLYHDGLRESYAAKTENGLTRSGTLLWKEVASLLTDQADKVCGRGPLPTDLPCNGKNQKNDS